MSGVGRLVSLSPVAECTVPECVYNHGSRCYAYAISVGNGPHPECITFHAANSRAARHEGMAGVGACKVYACANNRDYQCTAARIYVGYQDNVIACLTFRTR